ncbi:hypothetical protein KW521_04990 [Vibrio fluvialis]|nr:hypothetical protein [Vibrio fluvialis]
MSYLDTLIEMKDKVEASSDLQANHKIILIQLIENERAVKNAEEDPFSYFYKNISSREDIFDFQSKLGDSYGLAQGHADCCIKIFSDFSKLEPNIKLQNWLSSAIRMVDCIVIHYLQEVLNEEPIAQDGKGKERKDQDIYRLTVKELKLIKQEVSWTIFMVREIKWNTKLKKTQLIITNR